MLLTYIHPAAIVEAKPKFSEPNEVLRSGSSISAIVDASRRPLGLTHDRREHIAEFISQLPD